MHPLGLLQRLSILEAIWEDLRLEFITSLPPVKGYFVIVVVVEHISKYCHLGSLLTTNSAIAIVKFF